MRFFPFGSASVTLESISSSYADYSFITNRGILALSASVAISGSPGPQGDPGLPSTFHGPYDSFPPTL